MVAKAADLIGAGGGGDTVDGGTAGRGRRLPTGCPMRAAAGAISVNLGAHTASGNRLACQNIDGVSGACNFNDTLTGGDATNQWFNGEKIEWFQGQRRQRLDRRRPRHHRRDDRGHARIQLLPATPAPPAASLSIWRREPRTDGLGGTDTLVGINGVMGFEPGRHPDRRQRGLRPHRTVRRRRR
jgi:hypothetical protein